MSLPKPQFQISSLQNGKRMNFCCFKTPSLWLFVLAALRNENTATQPPRSVPTHQCRFLVSQLSPSRLILCAAAAVRFSTAENAISLPCLENKMQILHLVGVLPASTLSTLQSPCPLTPSLLPAPGRDWVPFLLSLVFASPVIYVLLPFSSLRSQIKRLLLQEALPDCSN